LANDKARAEAAAQSGRYVLAADAKQEAGRIAGRMMAIFETSLSELANAIVAAPPASPRDALRTLRSTWRSIRARQTAAFGAEAAALPASIEDEGGEDAQAA
jgi:predicted transcriptional regulator